MVFGFWKEYNYDGKFYPFDKRENEKKNEQSITLIKKKNILEMVLKIDINSEINTIYW